MGCCASSIPFSEPFGDHEVAFVEVRLTHAGSAVAPSCIIFYPRGEGGGPSKRQYFRQTIIEHGIVSHSDLRYACCLGFRMQRPFPCHENAKVKMGINKNGLPLVIFSHGLFGCKEMYTSLARNLASEGIVVICIEHEDGSACYHVKKDGAEGRYVKPPDGIKYSNREEVRAFRLPFLEKRAAEVEAVLAALILGGVGDDVDSQDTALPPPPPGDTGVEETIESIRRAIDKGNIHLCGHSFGAASMMYVTDRAERLIAGKAVIQSRILLDTWPYPLPASIEEGGTRALPSLFMASEEFMTGEEVELTKKLAKGSPNTQFCYVRGSVHQQFSDTPLWFPTSLGRRLKTTGSCDRLEAYQAIHVVTTAFIRLDQPKEHSLICYGYSLVGGEEEEKE